MKKFLAVIFAAVLLVSCFAGCSEKSAEQVNKYSEIDLVKDGRTDYVIVLPEEAQEYEQTAAEELQTFFERATGIVLPIHEDSEGYSLQDHIFALGDTTLKTEAGIDTSAVGRHGFVLKKVENAVIVAGKDGRGTVYGVYEFLERQFNYRYYAGDEIKIDNTANCKLIDVDVTDAPYISDYSVGYASIEGYYNSALRYRAEHDFKIHYWPHSHLTLLPPSVYGDRQGWYNAGKTALCLTNPEVMEEMAKVVIEFFENTPDAEYIMLGAEDNWDRCSCENCFNSDNKYTATGTDIIFNNYVADRLKEHFEPLGRTANVVSLNYYNTEKPPVVLNEQTQEYEPIDDLVIPHENVYVQICYLYADYSAPFKDQSRNASQIYNLDGWKALTDNLTAYTYNGWFVNQGLVFFDDFAYKSDYIKTLGEYGYSFVHMEGTPTRATTFEPLRAYISAELFWDPEQDVNILISDFIENYFKAAAPYIREYFDKINLHMSEMKAMYEAENKSFGAHPQFEMNNYLRTERTWPQRLLEQYLELFDSAYQAIEQAGYDDDVYEKLVYRLRLEELSPRYLLLLLYPSSSSTYLQQVAQFNEDSASLGSSIRL